MSTQSQTAVKTAAAVKNSKIMTAEKAESIATADALKVAQAGSKLSQLVYACFQHAQQNIGGEFFTRYTVKFVAELTLQCELLGVPEDTPKRVARKLINAVGVGVVLSEHKTVAEAEKEGERLASELAEVNKAKKEANKIELAAKAAQGDKNAEGVLNRINEQEKAAITLAKAQAEKQATEKLETAVQAAKECGIDVLAIMAPVSHASEAWDSLLKRAAIAARTAGVSADQFIELAEQMIDAD